RLARRSYSPARSFQKLPPPPLGIPGPDAPPETSPPIPIAAGASDALPPAIAPLAAASAPPLPNMLAMLSITAPHETPRGAGARSQDRRGPRRRGDRARRTGSPAVSPRAARRDAAACETAASVVART